MYTTPQMPQEQLPDDVKSFPTLWELSLSTLQIWKSGWGIFSLINLGSVLLGTITWMCIVAIMPWIYTFITEGNSIDPLIIASHYPTTASLVVDLALVCGVLIIFIICMLISQIMTMYAINPEIRHRGIKHILMLSLKTTPRYMFTAGIIGLIVLGGTSLLLIPGLLLVPLAIVTVFVVTLENKSGMKAINQAAEYTKGHFIEALWQSTAIILIIHMISLVLPLLATLLVYPFTLLDFSEYTIRILSFIAGTLYTFISFVLSLILPSLLIIYYYHIYTHAKDNPTQAKVIHPHILKVLIAVGAILVICLLLLETFGV